MDFPRIAGKRGREEGRNNINSLAARNTHNNNTLPGTAIVLHTHTLIHVMYIEAQAMHAPLHLNVYIDPRIAKLHVDAQRQNSVLVDGETVLFLASKH